jgi:hypothetical protein
MGGQMQGHAALEHGYWFNSPYVVANVTQVISMLWLPMAAALTGSIAARDFQSRMFPLSCATPTGRFDYLAGHFLAAFALNALLALAIPLAMLPVSAAAIGSHSMLITCVTLATTYGELNQ